MCKYAHLVGITFNIKKTGSVRISSELDLALPQGAAGWGFLVFDYVKEQFVVDQEAVDIHIEELRQQLALAKSVFGYVNALNKYLPNHHLYSNSTSNSSIKTLINLLTTLVTPMLMRSSKHLRISTEKSLERLMGLW